jgi:hypothetical protein
MVAALLLSLASRGTSKRAGERGLKNTPPLPDPLLHFAEEREMEAPIPEPSNFINPPQQRWRICLAVSGWRAAATALPNATGIYDSTS